MKIGGYDRQELPSGKGGAAFSLPGEKRRPLDVPSDERAWGAISDATGIIADVGKRLVQARNVEEYGEAKIRTLETFADIDKYMMSEEFLKNTDPDEFEKVFAEKAAEAWPAIAEKIKDPQTSSLARQNFDQQRVSGLVRARSHARTIQVEKGKLSTHVQLDRLKNMVLKGDAAGNTTAVADAIVEAEALVAGKVKAGFWQATEGKTLLEEFRRSTGKTLWEQRISTDPIGSYAALKDKITYLDEADRLDLLRLARAEAERKEDQLAEAAAYNFLKNKFGDDYNKMIDYLAKPANIVAQKLTVRSAAMLENKITGERNELLNRKEYARVEGARAEATEIYKAFRESRLTDAASLVNAAKNMDPGTLYNISTAIKRNRWETLPAVHASVIDGIMNGKITEPVQLLGYIGNGIAPDAVKNLEGMINKQRELAGQLNYYTMAVDWFTSQAKNNEGLQAKESAFKITLTWFMQNQKLKSNDPRVYELGKKILGDEMVVGSYFGFIDKDRTILDVMIEERPWLGTPGGQQRIVDVDMLDASPDEVKKVYEFLDENPTWQKSQKNKGYLLKQLREKGKIEGAR